MPPTPAREHSIEVTAEDAAAMAGLELSYLSPSNSSSPNSKGNGHGSNSSTSSSVAKILKNLTLRPPKVHTRPSSFAAPRGDFSSRPHYSPGGMEGDNSSFNSESMGQMSVAQTVASLDTVKMSNRQAPTIVEENAQHHLNKNSKKTPWKKIKKFIGLPPGTSTKKVQDDDCHQNYTAGGGMLSGNAATAVTPTTSTAGPGSMPIRRTHSKSEDLVDTEPTPLSRRRTTSMDLPKPGKKSNQQQHAMSIQKEQSRIDDAVRGRLDGMDMLYLGPAHQISLERQTKPTSESSTPWEPSPTFSFAGRTTQYTAQRMVTDMMWRSFGQESPEIILEGFFRDDRWIVPIDVPRRRISSSSSNDNIDLLEKIKEDDGQNSPGGLPPLQLTDEEDHSHSTTAPDEIPRHKLWGSMWGSENKPPPKPSHMSSIEDIEESDSILEMAASCNVPIDVDEDTFMISNAQHLQAVHELASAPLQHGRFDEALEIFKRIYKGVEIQSDEALRHLEGVTLHNMAVILMWLERYDEALETAGKATKSRLQYLPENHPDIAVSLVRQGYAYFALEKFDMAVASFQAAVEKIREDNVVKAKVLNNLGVALYQRGNDVGALKKFTDALEIQRLSLQGPIRREANVFGAAVLLGNMGKIHIKRGDYDLAISIYEEALLLQTSIFRKDHEMVLGTLISLSLAWAFNAEPQKAGQILNGVLRSQMAKMGPGTTEVVEITGTIGNLHFGLGNYEDALKCFTPVLKWQKAHLAPDHPALRKTKDIMKRIKKSIQAVWV